MKTGYTILVKEIKDDIESEKLVPLFIDSEDYKGLSDEDLGKYLRHCIDKLLE